MTAQGGDFRSADDARTFTGDGARHDEVRAWLDELDAARQAATDRRLLDDEGALTCEEARHDLVNAVPSLTAALRAVLDRLDHADGTGRVVYGIDNGGAVWARDIRAVIEHALDPAAHTGGQR